MTLPVAASGFDGAGSSSEKIGERRPASNWRLPFASRPAETAATKSSLGRFGVKLPGAGEKYGLRFTALFVLFATVDHGAVSPTANMRMPSAPASRARRP